MLSYFDCWEGLITYALFLLVESSPHLDPFRLRSKYADLEVPAAFPSFFSITLEIDSFSGPYLTLRLRDYGASSL